MFFWLQRRTSKDKPVEKYYCYNVCIMVRYILQEIQILYTVICKVFTENEFNSVTTTFIIVKSIVKFFLI